MVKWKKLKSFNNKYKNKLNKFLKYFIYNIF